MVPSFRILRVLCVSVVNPYFIRVVQRQGATSTRLKRWFDSTRAYQPSLACLTLSELRLASQATVVHVARSAKVDCPKYNFDERDRSHAS